MTAVTMCAAAVIQFPADKCRLDNLSQHLMGCTARHVLFELAEADREFIQEKETVKAIKYC